MRTYKILVVEDDPVYIKILSHILNEIDNNILVLQTNNGIEALEILKNEIPDLILTDWDMPQMSGIEFCKKVQSIQEYKDIPVIMCTGINTSSENLKTAFELIVLKNATNVSGHQKRPKIVYRKLHHNF